MLRLSEAIRLGAMLDPQGFGLVSRMELDTTCAWEAALKALGVINLPHPVCCTDLEFSSYIKEHFNWVVTNQSLCPAGCKKVGPFRPMSLIASVIIHLNDVHHWTREQIADWVETVEPADDPTPVPQPAEPALCEAHNPYTCPMEPHTHPDERASLANDPQATRWEQEHAG